VEYLSWREVLRQWLSEPWGRRV